MTPDVAAYGQDLNELFRQQNIGERLKRPNGFMLMIQQINDWLDEKNKQKHQEKMAKAGEDAATARQKSSQDFTAGQADKAAARETDQQLLAGNIKSQADQLAQQQTAKQQEEIATWTQHANDAALSIYSNPHDEEAFKDGIASINEANHHIIAAKGTPVDIGGVITHAQQIRAELRTIGTEKTDKATETARREWLDAMDEMGNSTTLKEYKAATKKMQRAAFKYQGAADPTMMAKIMAIHADDGGDGSDEGKPVTPDQSMRAASMFNDLAPPGSARGKQMPPEATTNPDSLALGTRIATELPERGPDTTMARKAGEIRTSFLEERGKKKATSFDDLWKPDSTTKIITGTKDTRPIPMQVPPKESTTGPAQKTYPEDNIIDAWVATMQGTKLDNREMALARIKTPSLREKVKKKLGW